MFRRILKYRELEMMNVKKLIINKVAIAVKTSVENNRCLFSHANFTNELMNISLKGETIYECLQNIFPQRRSR